MNPLTAYLTVAATVTALRPDADGDLVASIVKTLLSYLRLAPTFNQLAAVTVIALDVGIDTISVSGLVRRWSVADLDKALLEFDRWGDHADAKALFLQPDGD